MRSIARCAPPRRRVIASALQTWPRAARAGVRRRTESAALLKVMADVDPAIPVIFLDTGWLSRKRWPNRDT